MDLAERSLPDEPASDALRDRLRALADTYRLVSGADWGTVPLAELVGRELADFGIGREGRVVVEGPAVRVRANAAVNLGMALHELAARAAAKGALSQPQGRVHLAWAIEPANGAERRLVIRWRESGEIAGATRGDGYATELIERGLAERIGASLSVSLADGGLTAEIALPLASGLVLLPSPEGT